MNKFDVEVHLVSGKKIILENMQENYSTFDEFIETFFRAETFAVNYKNIQVCIRPEHVTYAFIKK